MDMQEIFDTMAYGPAPEDASGAEAWLDSHNRRFGAFVDGQFTAPGALFATRNPATGAVLAEVTQCGAAEVDAALAAARRAQPGWEALGGAGRARILYALARGLQRHARHFALLDTLDNGKPIRETRDVDVPLAARHFTYHAGLAQLLAQTCPEQVASGVAVQIIPWNFPLLMLAWKIAPALAAGCTVVLKPAEYTPLSALRFAELTQEAGVPAGVINILTGDGETGAALVAAQGYDKLAFTGSTEVGQQLARAVAGRGIDLTLELGGKSPFIVFEDADLDAAIEGVVDAIWFNQGEVCCAGSRLLVQESIAERFIAKLKARMATLRVGDPLDKAIDIGALVDPSQKHRIEAMLAAEPAARIFAPDMALPEQGCFLPPMLIEGLSTASPLMQEEIFGPALVTMPFRTPEEAVALANNSRYGLAASVWSETLALALDVAPKLEVGVVWINATNLFDAAAGFGGLRESGFGREGGWEGLQAYLKPARTPVPLTAQPMAVGQPEQAAEGLDRTPKLLIGGKQTRPDGGWSARVWGAKGEALGTVPLANRKDLRNAVEAARGALKAWAGRSAYNRSQILYFLAENLAAAGPELAPRLRAMTGQDGEAEVAAAVDRLFHWAAMADKFGGELKQVPLRGLALGRRRPTGVIAVLCADEAPLLSLMSVIAPALAMGNSVVAVASERHPLAALEAMGLWLGSDIPPGVLNILTGRHAELAPTLARHADIDAVWSFSSQDLSAEIERGAADTLKRVWVNHGLARDWWGEEGSDMAFAAAATEVQTLWVPFGA